MLLHVAGLCTTRQLERRTSTFIPVTFICRFLGRGEGRRERNVAEGTRWKSLYNCFFFSLCLGGSLILSQWLQCLVQSVFLYHLDIYWCYLTLETLLEGDGLSSIYFYSVSQSPQPQSFSLKIGCYIIWYSYMWNLKRNVTNKLTYKIETHRLREWTNGCQGKGIVREFGIHVHTAIF